MLFLCRLVSLLYFMSAIEKIIHYRKKKHPRALSNKFRFNTIKK